jgi:hypothetical protein
MHFYRGSNAGIRPRNRVGRAGQRDNSHLSWWKRLSNRQFVLLCTIWAGMAGAIYAQGFGLRLPVIDGLNGAVADSAWNGAISICRMGRRTTCLLHRHVQKRPALARADEKRQ